MTGRPVIVYDANVLFSAHLRDLLIRLAKARLIRAHWTDSINEEWMQSLLAKRTDLKRQSLERTRTLMEKALPAARVEGYECHISGVALPDPDDRHVVAVGIHIEAQAIVTFNLKDFPKAELAKHGLEAIHPDEFVQSLYQVQPDSVLRAMRRHRASLRRPSFSAMEYLAALTKVDLVKTVAALKGRVSEL